MHTPRLLASIVVFATAGSSVALAASDIDQAANDPTYEAKELRCTSGGCTIYVINDKGIGIQVDAMNKKWASKKAEAKATELNAAAQENRVSQDDDGVSAVCETQPSLCSGSPKL